MKLRFACRDVSPFVAMAISIRGQGFYIAGQSTLYGLYSTEPLGCGPESEGCISHIQLTAMVYVLYIPRVECMHIVR